MDTQLFEHAIHLRDSGRVEEAVGELEGMLEVTPEPEEKASLLVNLARCYRLLGRLREAKRGLCTARRIAPRAHLLPYVEFEEAVVHWHEGDRAEALDILNRLDTSCRSMLTKSEHQELYQQIQGSRGMLLTELSRYKEATPLLEQSLYFDSRVIEKEAVLRDLGLCYLETGDRDRAKTAFEECLKERAHGVYATQVRYYLGTIYFERAAFARALLEFEACVPASEEARLPLEHIYGYLARTARHLGMEGEAERYDKLAKG